MSQEQSPFKRHVATAGWAVGVAVALLLPGDVVSFERPAWQLLDLAAHGLLFFGMALLARRSLSEAGVEPTGRWAWWASLAYAVLLELLQIPVPGRGFQLIDIVAAAVGGSLAVALAGRVLSR